MDRPRGRHRHHRGGHGARNRNALIDSVLGWLAGLPPSGIYGVIAVLAALENIFPPVPADTAVALGAFLAAREAPVSILGVYVATVTANVATAVGMYLLAGRYGRGVLESRLIGTLLSRKAVRAIQRLYERHHGWGLFVCRFLPGYRAIVPPFAAAVGIPARKAIPPIALATMLYYAVLVAVSYQIGSNWDSVRQVVNRIGLGLGLAALAATAGLVWLARRWWRAHRHD